MPSSDPAVPHSAPGPVLVMGAGAIGCWLGGMLAAAGVAVTLVGRPRVLGAVAEHGLTLSWFEGGTARVEARRLVLSEHVPAGASPALVLLAVKSGATAEAAAQLARSLPPRTLVVSMQNGISNADVAQRAAPSLDVRAGMVPYNVAELSPGHYHRGTTGALAMQDDARLVPWQAVFERAGLALERHADLRPVQWGKLLLNLNNPVNALSGLPLRAELLDRDCRRCLAALIDEALAVLQRAGITPARVAAVPPHALPPLLRLPTPVFRLLAARMLRIDEKARSSMADDLAHGRVTEIDALCGEVVRLARTHGTEAPINARMQTLVQAWPEQRRVLEGATMRRALLG